MRRTVLAAPSCDGATTGWTIPVGADVGTAFAAGSKTVTVQLRDDDLVARPAGDPARVLRAEATPLFALGRHAYAARSPSPQLRYGNRRKPLHIVPQGMQEER